MADIPIIVRGAIEDKMQVFPNPAYGLIHIRTGDNVQSFEMSIFDQSGRLIFHDTFTEGELHQDMSAYKKGIYLIRIQTPDQVSHHSLLPGANCSGLDYLPGQAGISPSLLRHSGYAKAMQALCHLTLDPENGNPYIELTLF